MGTLGIIVCMAGGLGVHCADYQDIPLYKFSSDPSKQKWNSVFATGHRNQVQGLNPFQASKKDEMIDISSG